MDFRHLPYAPCDPRVDHYIYSRTFGMGLDSMVPLECEGWREEEASWRQTCYVHAGRNVREMLSLCSIDIEHGGLGEEVSVLWGKPGMKQKEIRATVARFPYLNENRNENVDVDAIPCQVSTTGPALASERSLAHKEDGR